MKCLSGECQRVKHLVLNNSFYKLSWTQTKRRKQLLSTSILDLNSRYLSMPRRKQSSRKRKHVEAGNKDGWKNEINYRTTIRKNELFVKYYQGQNFVPEGEWDQFEQRLKEDLPVTFRITGSRSMAKQLLKVVKGQYFSSIVTQTLDDGSVIQPPKVLPWYPDELAWQINMSRTFIRNSTSMGKLHDFLIAETESGNISRQEAVSMIPPLLMDIKPHHKILDLCAAPGSKTAQLIEYLHADETRPIPDGYVIANDKDNKRCYLMVHQVKRLQSPNCIIVNQDATFFPKIRTTPEGQPPEFLSFDRILADVPCSGDGTMRKNPDVWAKWQPYHGAHLHSLQLKILKRGLELLTEGGRLVYSTCSFNPIEDEAVIAEMLRKCQGTVELVDVQDSLPGLQTVPGLSTWRCMSAQGEWNDLFEGLPQNLQSIFRPSMFPPTQEEANWMHLERCVRVLPHHQNTGGFFICVLRKNTNLPWQKPNKPVVKTDETSISTSTSNVVDGSADAYSDSLEEHSRLPVPKKQKQGPRGYKEDPFLFFKGTDPVWDAIKEFYKIPDDFPTSQIMYRSEQGNRKNLYFVSSHIKAVAENNAERVKYINMGIKIFSRNPSPLVPECDFRVNQECLASLYKCFPGRYVTVEASDMIILLSEENPFVIKFKPKTVEQLENLSPGSAVFHYKPSEQNPDPECDIVICGWRGRTSIRSFVGAHEREHFLFLFGLSLREIRAKVGAEKARRAEAANAVKETDEVKEDATEIKDKEEMKEDKEEMKKDSEVATVDVNTVEVTDVKGDEETEMKVT